MTPINQIKHHFTKCSLADLALLIEIGRETFYDTYAHSTTREDMMNYLDQSFSDEKMTAEIGQEHSHFYFMWIENQLTGYLKLNFPPHQTEFNQPGSMEIERCYLRKAFWEKGLGGLLIRQAVKIASDHRAKVIWLGVWQENPRAIRFYEKHGFTITGTHLFYFNEVAHADFKMELKL